jgi:oligopeptidase A
MNENTLPENPLYNQGDLPDFSAIKSEHVVPAVREAIRIGQEKLKSLESLQNPTWQTFVLPLRDISRRLDRIWGTVGHLLGVKNSEALRAAHEEVQPEVVEFQLSVGQNLALFKNWQALKAAGSKEISSPARARIVDAAIRDARLSGVALEGEKQKRFNEIQRDLAALATKFSNAVLDATKAFQVVLTKPEEIAGLPQSWRAGAAHAAQAKGHAEATAENGPWLVTLDYPSYYPVLQHAQNRALREQVYRASLTRASSEKLNNWPVIDEILRLRQEDAQILGFANYAEVSLSAKMAPDTKKVREIIVNLGKVAKPQAQREFAELANYAKQKGHEDALQLWDIAFYSERRREELYSFTDEELRPYFPLPKVLTGMFQLAEKLFAVKIGAATTQPKVWHKDVQYFDVNDAAGKKIAGFFLDPYARSGEKRGGAWMDVCRQREITEHNLVLPIAYLVCNGTPPVPRRNDSESPHRSGVEGPVGDKPSLMTFTEVETLFHEFGHGLQHMLTTVDEYEASGISNVEWDAVELPSQFMENWVYERTVIDQISGHFETGETLPQPLFEKIIAAKNYMAGSILLRQLYFSLLDLELHEVHGCTRVGVAMDGETVRDVQRRIAAEYTVIPPLPEDAFLCSFSHIFAGGYAAGYYSYKWAEVLSADAFAAFEEVGLSNDAAIRELGKRYRETVLARGGSEHPLEVYRSFRGRDATIDALLRHNGLIAAA